MKIKNKVAILLALSMMVSMGNAVAVNAEELDKEFPTLTEESGFDEAAEVGSIEQFKGDVTDEILIDDSGIALTAVGDSYESNNYPDTATNGRYNKMTYATIHEARDVDYYKIEVIDASKPISIFLTNIPAGCDYDLFLIQYDFAKGEITKLYCDPQSGSTPERLYGTVDEEGIYYVAVQGNQDLQNNFSSSTYALYIGDYYKTDYFGYVSTGLKINFGDIPVGNETPVYRGWYTYDLTNAKNIPDDAMVTDIYLTGGGNGASWSGFYKMMAAAGQGLQLQDKLGQIDLMYKGENQLKVKQQWLIGGHILASSNFVWEPQILMGYRYAAVIANLKFLV